MRSKKTLATLVALSLGFATAATAQNNVLVNGDFELNPPPKFGNNVDFSIFPWVLGAGDQSNVVKVDGPGGYDYGSNGPESDASAAGPRRVRHYLDIVGQNEFYQSFSPQCSGSVVFGASFSTRANDPGMATVSLYEGVGSGGTLVASNQVSLLGGNSRTDAWRQVTFSAPVEALETYSLVIFMENELNVDNVFARFVERCDPPDPCCPPWNSALLESMLFYESGGGAIGSSYTLKFRPSDPWKGQMQAYLDYLHTRNALITDLNLAFRLHDAGPGTNPSASGPQVGMTYFTWFLEGGNGAINGSSNFFTLGGESMQVNRWYRVETGIFLNDRLTFFPAACAENRIFVRIQVRRSAAAAPARAQVEFLLPDGSVVTRKLEAEFR
ncbi:MAG: hypothetical protein SF066_18445 [Thermoanaerobaculia bacterium]|nr:hypothetical protein [Thermoanaerobaculia bacterium]